jgi:DNA adenine methylase
MIPATRPVLKWAGGKSQMLSDLVKFLPDRPYRYVEPMIGGGALFFALGANSSLIADSNPELINLYTVLKENPDGISEAYREWEFSEAQFYALRSLKFSELEPVKAAARTIYLNRHCFNGLYRVNRSGDFNVPWGQYKKPYKIDPDKLKSAQSVLQDATIILGDFREVLRNNATRGDFIFLDPPYVPISNNADFKRYTREQFHDSDHIEMAVLVKELAEKGCDIVITNSNHPFVLDLYREYDINIIPTKRNVNSRGNGRTGEDAIIYVPSA